MMIKLFFIHMLVIMTSISFAQKKVDVFQTRNNDIHVKNLHSNKSITDILESADSANPRIDDFEIRIFSNTGEPELRCRMGADILKAYYSKNKSKYSKASKERSYSDLIQDVVKEYKVTRVEPRPLADKSKVGKEK